MTKPVRYYATRLWSKPPSNLSTVTKKFLRICDGKHVPAVRPFFQQEQASRIKDGQWYSAGYLRAELTARRQAELRPLFVHEFRDACLVDGSVYLGSRSRIELRSERARGNSLRRMSMLPVRPHLERPKRHWSRV
jgi:hypothetical protein